jgi:mitogen-activated protein kinase 1/3
MATPEEMLAAFDVGPRYINTALIGSGAYGTVVSALDTETQQKVAIKKLNKLEDIIDARRNLREIRCMRYLRHENILGLNSVIHKR